jgi:hypothetical protein
LIIEVPDCNDLEEKHNNGKISDGQYRTLTKGTPEMEYQEHLCTFTTLELSDLFTKSGFSRIIIQPDEMTSILGEAIRIDGRK